MKRLWIVAVLLCALTPFASAQRGGGSRRGGTGNFGGGRGFGAAGRFARDLFVGDRFGRSNFNGGFGWPGYGGWGFPFVDDYDYAPPDPPTVIVPVTIQFTGPPLPPPPPPDPARLAVRTYVWPDAPEPQSANTFAILSKDGGMRSAIAVWVDGGQLHYKTADGGGGRVPIGQIDREATVRANAERGLKLWLP
jgi:hypothetical protein